MINGNVSMINANVIVVNSIVSDIALRIQEKINSQENNNFNLKLGSLTGTKLLAGRGPNLNIKIETTGSVDTELRSEFISQGINQTLHKMYLHVECNITILTPYDTIDEKITNQILIAEAVILGTTPETYFDISNKSGS